MIAKDVVDSRLADLVNAERSQFAEDVGIPPARFAGDPEYELSNLLRSARPASTTASDRWGAIGLILPAKECSWLNDRDQTPAGAPEWTAQFEQSCAFPRRAHYGLRES